MEAKSILIQLHAQHTYRTSPVQVAVNMAHFSICCYIKKMPFNTQLFTQNAFSCGITLVYISSIISLQAKKKKK